MKVMKILLVDDDALVRDMYETKFTEAGDTVVVAETAAKALSRLDEGLVDVVVMDMIMPGMTGVELIKAVHGHHNGAEAKCIVLSNQGDEDKIAEAKSAGAAGYIIKAELIPSEVVTKVHELAT